MEFVGAKKRFGFGCMRLPMKGEEVDIEQFKAMVDRFIEEGYNYFDTAHGYIGGLSEKALKVALTSRYPRDKYLLANKLSPSYFKKEEDIIPLFLSQLEITGAGYFDYYLMHAQSRRNFSQYRECRAYETAFELKRRGLIKHVGISFHDTEEMLEEILSTYPEIEFVQIQFNYLDYYSPSVQSKKLYEVCVKHNKPIIVMEPVKGGQLVNLPDGAKRIFDEIRGEKSYASYAIRFALHFPQIAMVLSGMSDFSQMEDNISSTKDYVDLSEDEMKAIEGVRDILASQQIIPCTKCRYCVTDNACPMNIQIPDLFAAYNDKKSLDQWATNSYYNTHLTGNGKGLASECIGCGGCEAVCPQKLPIREWLIEVKNEFEQ
ncbi:MAG: aldo/keto reductase [Bacilli bacterium]|nr:aldo/keto reductase [Bacilli bacterium]